MATNEAERVMDALAPISGESTEYLFQLISEKVREPLTPEKKAYKLAPQGAHRPNRVRWEDEAYDQLLEAIELGDVE